MCCENIKICGTDGGIGNEQGTQNATKHLAFDIKGFHKNACTECVKDNRKGTDSPGCDVMIVELEEDLIQNEDHPATGSNGGAAASEGINGIVINDSIHIHVQMGNDTPNQHGENRLLHSGR